jgi:hypothetical protein
MLSFDGVVRDGHRHGVVAMDRGFWLRATHIFEGESKNNPRLAIVVEGLDFASVVEATTKCKIIVLTWEASFK